MDELILGQLHSCNSFKTLGMTDFSIGEWQKLSNSDVIKSDLALNLCAPAKCPFCSPDTIHTANLLLHSFMSPFGLPN